VDVPEVVTETAIHDSFHLSDYVADNSQVITLSLTPTAPETALSLCESALSAAQFECYKFCLSRQYDLTNDDDFMAWKYLKSQSQNVSETDVPVSVTDMNISVNSDLGNISLSELLPFVGDNIAHEVISTSDTTECSAEPLAIGNLEQPSGSDLLTQCDVTAEHSSKQEPHLTAVKNGHGNCFSFQNRSYPGDPDSDILSYPAPVMRKKSKANKEKFFLLTSKEARESKLKEIQQIAVREQTKKEKEAARAKKQQEKLQERSRKSDSKSGQDKDMQTKSRTKQQGENRKPARVRTQNKTSVSRRIKRRRLVDNTSQQTEAADDLTPCAICSVKYCDSNNQSWIQCQDVRPGITMPAKVWMK